ncbi:hypothetical protein B5M50_00815 [candidate division KSB1 bacterium 4484_219]|nr:MAG: hypothetical protein B5M50_00815 [candidate division KSB1 bacterium 4484_219]
MAKREEFSTRWGIILAALGMAIGAGNIWRFPRLVAQNGGSAFLIPWLIFLFLWSIPLLMVEFAIGKTTRLGTIGAFGKFMGRKFTWMGCFVGFCTMGIMFYYSVVTGWSLHYFLRAGSGQLLGIDYSAYWNQFTGSGYLPLLFHLLAISTGIYIVYHGVVAGIERANKLLIPSLFLLIIIAAIRALLLPNAVIGLNYLFYPDWAKLLNYRVWLEGLSQSAWSTGAGWGLILTYGIYLKIPHLFDKMPAGSVFATIFFLALFFAALSSLISMIELTTRIFMDMGMQRRQAIKLVWTIGFLLGVPSAISLSIFNNQDWVWGIGLLLSGFFFAVAVNKFGARNFRLTLLNVEHDIIKVGRWFEWVLKYLIPVEFVALLLWWFYQSIVYYEPNSWWNPFKTYSLGTCLVQWGVVLTIFIIFNRQITRLVLKEKNS